MKTKIWMVTHKVDDALALASDLIQIDKKTGREILSNILEISHDCGHVALLTAYDFRMRGDREWLQHWIDVARRENYYNQPMLVFSELLLCYPDKEPEKALELSDTVLERGDFPPLASYSAYYNRLLAFIALGDFESAEKLVRHVLLVGRDNYHLHMEMILRFARGRTEVEDILAQMELKDENHRHFVLSLAWLDAGDRDAAALEIQKCSHPYLHHSLMPARLKALIGHVPARKEQNEHDL